MLKAKLLAGGGAETIYVDDVFSAYTRTGTGASQVTTTNIDMTQGYMLWSKGRSGATDHAIYDSARGVTKDLVSNTTAAETTQSQGLTAVSATGHTFGTLAKVNTNAATYVDWVFRKAPKFFSQATATVTGGADATVSFSDLATLGMVIVKRTDSTGSWYVWHRSLTAGKLLYLEQTAAEATLGHITVSGTTVTLEGGVIADGNYIVYAWAHDTATDGIVQCGSFTTDGSRNVTVSLGWEPQYLMVKTSGVADDWMLIDTSRGFTVGGDDARLAANSSAAESANIWFTPLATGFKTDSPSQLGVSTSYIYLAIRRPNKPPTLGTQVYQAIARTGTGTNSLQVTGVGFAPDLIWPFFRTGSVQKYWFDRLRGNKWMYSTATNAENSGSASDGVVEYQMNGYKQGSNESTWFNQNTYSYIDHFFKRAPGVFDQVCWTGDNTTNRSIPHQLSASPELVIWKNRTSTLNWAAYSSSLLTTDRLYLNLADAVLSTSALLTSVSSSDIVAASASGYVNASGSTYVAYLFATKAGISKCGSYTGNGSSLTLNMGFTTGARFFMVKRTDSTGDWYVWDTTRGIIAGNDGHLSLNTIAAEVTTDDSVDPDTSGLIVNQLAATNINVNAATYIYLAFA